MLREGKSAHCLQPYIPIRYSPSIGYNSNESKFEFYYCTINPNNLQQAAEAVA